MPYYSGGKNNLKLGKNVGENYNDRTIVAANDVTGDKNGSLLFGSSNVRISSESVTTDDSLGNTWTIVTEGTNSFSLNKNTNNIEYCQVGSSSKPATSITFECTLDANYAIVNFLFNLGGNSGTAGDVSIKVGEQEIGTGMLNATEDVTVRNNKSAVGNKITISITNIAKGVNIYGLSYDYNIASESDKAKISIENETTKAQLKYSFDVSQGEAVPSFVKVTSEPSDWSGLYLLGYETTTDVIRVLNANLTSETIATANNYSTVTDYSNDKINYTSDLFSMTVSISSMDGGYAIKSNSKGYYFNGNTSPKGVSTSNTASAHTLTFDSSNNRVIVKDSSSELLLQYNSSYPRFHYYGSSSNQQNVYLYKYTEQIQYSYTFYNMKMNLGAIIEASKVQALMDAGLSITSYGVAVAQKSKLVESSISDAIINKDSYVSFVSQGFTSLEVMQKTDASGTAKEGNYVIFTANLPIGDSNFTTDITSVAYFLLDDGTESGEYVFLNECTWSVKSLAQAYVDNKEVYNNFDSNIQGSLKALAALTVLTA